MIRACGGALAYTPRILTSAWLPCAVTRVLPLARALVSSAAVLKEPSTEAVVRHWTKLLDTSGSSAGHSAISVDDASLQSLVQVAVDRGRSAVGVLPDPVLATFMRVYKEMLHDNVQKRRMFDVLGLRFGVREKDVEDGIRRFQSSLSTSEPGGDERPLRMLKASLELSKACQPLYASLFVPLSQQPGGLKFLVDMRADLLDALSKKPKRSAHLSALSDNLKNVLTEWFSVGLLQLRKIDWESTPAALLEKLVKYEAVHKIEGGLTELKSRIGYGRRVYAFFHPSMTDEPLVVLYTALTDAMADTVPGVLTSPRPVSEEAASAAVFFSISATQKGLNGISLGNFLIKEVAKRIKGELPHVDVLVTLSPIPAFRRWMEASLAVESERLAHRYHSPEASGAAAALDPLDHPIASRLRQHDIRGLLQPEQPTARLGVPTSLADCWLALLTLKDVLENDRWVANSALERVVQPILTRLLVHYLIQQRQRNHPLCQVANFHLRNGSWLWRINWRANMKFMPQSYGMMVNYRYILEDVTDNNRKFLLDHELAVSPLIAELLEELGDQPSAPYHVKDVRGLANPCV